MKVGEILRMLHADG